MPLAPSSAAATAKARAWVTQQLQTDSYTTNQSSGSRAARQSEVEKLAITVADLEKQVETARKRADYARRAREGTRTKTRAAARMPLDAPPAPPRRVRADSDDDDDAFGDLERGLDSLREKRDKARQRELQAEAQTKHAEAQLEKCLETLERAAQRRSAARRGEDGGAPWVAAARAERDAFESVQRMAAALPGSRGPCAADVEELRNRVRHQKQACRALRRQASAKRRLAEAWRDHAQLHAKCALDAAARRDAHDLGRAARLARTAVRAERHVAQAVTREEAFARRSAFASEFPPAAPASP